MIDMNKQTEMAFSSAFDTTKQMITLATAVLAVEVTFVQGATGKLDEITKYLISISWFSLIGSLIAGIWTLLSLTGWLAKNEAQTQSAIKNYNVVWPARWQIGLFFLGILFTVFFGIRVIWCGS